MLESYLPHPKAVTDELVSTILKVLFHQGDTKRLLEQVLAFLRNAPILFLHLPGPFLIAREDNHHADHGSVPDDKENILKRDTGTILNVSHIISPIYIVYFTF